ncbi:MAG: site-specific DNA-methyltransferase [Methanobacteriota archaeon]|nr:MAG: site-specific DNA-methyltransferase [Euryarchaeota archaeon]
MTSFLAVREEKEVTSILDGELMDIQRLDEELYGHFGKKIVEAPFLSRQVVSFQANKQRPHYRWYKYKEAFSAKLVEYLLDSYDIVSGNLLDPFAGIGTALFAASHMGLDCEGIELLPIGQEVISTRLLIEKGISESDIAALKSFCEKKIWVESKGKVDINHLRITKGAYPSETEELMAKFLYSASKQPDAVSQILKFAMLCILESISYTRKDGQYLRWDYRSGRRPETNTFNKGVIYPFNEAITKKIVEILDDIDYTNRKKTLFPQKRGNVSLLKGSCLEILKSIPDCKYDVILTSPPYCNRYDYTRTYALELALMGIDEQSLVKLRQQMLSCTVENKEKNLISCNPSWSMAIDAANSQQLLQSVLAYLEKQKQEKKLNNPGIYRMVKGYFYEMSCVIQECSRTLKPGGYMFMVNDNVRYAGASISVDLILSDLAEMLGFETKEILVLPQRKGNSSQQMGSHGRDALRKCVYVWRKK